PGEVLYVLLEHPDGAQEWFDDAVAAALEGLAPPERTVLLLRAVGEFSYREIHELLRMPPGSVVGYLSRARRKMREALADYAARRGLTRPRCLPGGQRP